MSADDIKVAGKKQNIDPMWKVLMKQVDFGEPTSFLDHVYFGCIPREYGTSRDIVDNKRNMFESRTFAGATEKKKHLARRNLMRTSLHNRVIGHEKICVERCCEWLTKRFNFTQFQLHAKMTINSKKKRRDW